MAINRHFKNDIFVSYAHLDNSSGLIDDIVKKLEERINELTGPETPPVKIWLDNKDLGNHLFNQEIKDQIKKSATFLILKSENYLKSDYCLNKELPYIEKVKLKYQTVLKLGNLSREIILQVSELGTGQTDIDRAHLNQFRLIQAGSNDYPSAPNDSYQESIDNICQLFVQTLENIANAEVDFTGMITIKIFVASAADDLKAAKMKLVRELETNEVMDERLDIEIIYGVPPPMSSNEHAERLKKCKDCDIVIHLFSIMPAEKLRDGAINTYYSDHAQYDFFSKSQPAPKLRVIWMDGEAYQKVGEQSEKEHWKFLNHIARKFGHTSYAANDQNENGEKVEMEQNGKNITRFIHSHASEVSYNLGPLIQQVVQDYLNTDPGLQTICLEFHPEASERGALLNTRLEATERVEVKLYVMNTAEDANYNSRLLEKQLRQSSKYVILLNSSNRLTWAKSKVQEVYKYLKNSGLKNEMILFMELEMDLSKIENTLKSCNVKIICGEDELSKYLLPETK